MQLTGKINTINRTARLFLTAFLLALSFGYGSGFYFLNHLTGLNETGVKEQYLGNEEDEAAETLQFKKSEGAIYTTIHNHAISLSIIFFCLGALLLTTSIHPGLKKFLVVEPFFSIITTFGGIWLLWNGITWMTWVIIFSGILMHSSFMLIVLLLLWQIWMVRSKSNG